MHSKIAWKCLCSLLGGRSHPGPRGLAMVVIVWFCLNVANDKNVEKYREKKIIRSCC